MEEKQSFYEISNKTVLLPTECLLFLYNNTKTNVSSSRAAVVFEGNYSFGHVSQYVKQDAG